MRSSAGSTPRTPPRTSPPRPGGSPPTASRPAPACGWTRRERGQGGRGGRALREDRQWLKALAFPPAERGAAGEEGGAESQTVEQSYTVEVSGKRFDVRVLGPAGGAGGVAGASNGAVPAADATLARAPSRSRRSGVSAGGGPDTL